LGRQVTPMMRVGCKVSVAQWDLNKGKGIDDLLVAHGRSSVDDVIKNAISFKKWAMPDQTFTEQSKSKSTAPVEIELDCTDSTFDAEIFKKVFNKGEGDWISIDSNFYKYEGQFFCKKNDDDMIKWIGSLSMQAYRVSGGKEPRRIKSYGNANTVKSAFSFNLGQLAVDSKKRELTSNYAVFNNGTLNLVTNEFTESHDRSQCLTFAIDSDYIADCECPKAFLDFVESSYGLGVLPVIRAFTAGFLNPKAKWGRFPHLIGKSGSGKGVLLRFWESLVGEGRSRQGYDFNMLSTPELRHQNLSGVSIFTFPDMAGFKTEPQAFYDLVENGASSGRKLYSGEGYSKKWNCRFAIASVSQIQLDNSGDGWERRCIPLPANRSGDKDPDLAEKLESIKAEVISWALAMDMTERDVILGKSDKPYNHDIAQAMHEQALYGDPIKQFVDMVLRPVDDANIAIQTQSIYPVYQQFCDSFGYTKMGLSRFSGRIYTILPENKVDRKAVRSDGVVNWIPTAMAFIGYKDGAVSTPIVNGDPNAEFQKHQCGEGGIESFKEFWASKRVLPQTEIILPEGEVRV